MTKDSSYKYEKIFNLKLEEHINIANQLKNSDFQSNFINAAKTMANTLRSGGLIMWCGNGGSAADCQHLAAELIGRFRKERKALKSISLTTDSSVLTSIANDWSYKNIFSRQLEGMGSEGDILVVVSTSGRSENIIDVVESARKLNIQTIGLLGNNGGLLKDMVNHSININSNVVARIQEMHIFLGHMLCEIIEEDLNLI